MHRLELALKAAAIAAWLTGVASAQDAEAGRRKAETCVACHGADGNSANPAYPNLAGQTARYIYLQLKDYKEGRRADPEMTPFVKDLSREDMLDIAALFASQKPLPVRFTPDPAKVEKGQAKAAEVLCTMCHLGGLKGQNEVPRLTGQHYEYTVKQMKAFKERRRTNDGGSMTGVSRTLSDEDIENLAQYLMSLY